MIINQQERWLINEGSTIISAILKLKIAIWKLIRVINNKRPCRAHTKEY